MLRLIAGVDMPAHGTVTINDLDLWRNEVEARRHLAFVPEYPELTPYATVVDVLRLVAAIRDADAGVVIAALERVGLLDVGMRTIRELSMGQRQRAMLATALIGDPHVVILDEPLETLDAGMRLFVKDWVFTLRERGATVLVATHDFTSFAPRVDTAISVQAGRVALHDLRELRAEGERLARLEQLVRGHGAT
jgi:ABC-type multidrug transport system ATPase subunit